MPGSDEWPKWSMWQYTSNGNVAGVNGRVDHNLFRGSIEEFKRIGLPRDLNVPGSPIVVPISLPPADSSTIYTIVRGDTLSKIAARHGKQWQQLYAINRDVIANPNKIYVGQKIRVWNTAQPVTPPQTVSAPPVPTTTHPTYTVVSGDNLTSIARRHGLNGWRQLYEVNRAVIGNDPNLIKAGQVLRIP